MRTECRHSSGQASVHKDLRICDLCKELAFGHQCVNGSSRDSYNSLEFNGLWRQFLESVHKCLRICDLCKELAFWSSMCKWVKSRFIQLHGIQHVVAPVPGESLIVRIISYGALVIESTGIPPDGDGLL